MRVLQRSKDAYGCRVGSQPSQQLSTPNWLQRTNMKALSASRDIEPLTVVQNSVVNQMYVVPVVASSSSSGSSSFTAHGQVARAVWEDTLPTWAQRFLRQVPCLPQGGDALERFLSSANNLLSTAASTYTGTGTNSTAASERCAVVQAYLQLALVDIVTAAWVQKVAELRMEEAVSGSSLANKQELQQASSALCGCRYLRLEAATHLAQLVHTILDAQGHSPGLNLSGMPLPHSVGLNFRQLLVKGLKVGDLNNPMLRGQHQSSLECHTWDDYYVNASNTSLCGDWQFCSWTGVARFEPAPYAKFSTAELMAQLEPSTIMASLTTGLWGRVLVAAGMQVGISLDCLLGASPGQETAARQNDALVSGKEIVRQVLALNTSRVETVTGSMKQAAVTAASAVVMAAAQLRHEVDNVLLATAPPQDAAGGSIPDAVAEPVVARR